MTDCPHERIMTLCIDAPGTEMHGRPTLWACAECQRKFEPLTQAGIARERALADFVAAFDAWREAFYGTESPDKVSVLVAFNAMMTARTAIPRAALDATEDLPA